MFDQLRKVVELTPALRASAARLIKSTPRCAITNPVTCAHFRRASLHMFAYLSA